MTVFNGQNLCAAGSDRVADQNACAVFLLPCTFRLHIGILDCQVFNRFAAEIAEQTSGKFFLALIHIKPGDGLVVAVKIAIPAVERCIPCSGADWNPTVRGQIQVCRQDKMLTAVTQIHNARIHVRRQLRKLLRGCDLIGILLRAGTAGKCVSRIIRPDALRSGRGGQRRHRQQAQKQAQCKQDARKFLSDFHARLPPKFLQTPSAAAPLSHLHHTTSRRRIAMLFKQIS